MSYYNVEGVLVKLLGQYKIGRSSLQFNCPHCDNPSTGDRGRTYYNLNVSLEKGVFHCWVCDDSGSIEWLIKKHGQDEDLSSYRKLAKDGKRETIHRKGAVRVALPDGFRRVRPNSRRDPSNGHYLAYRYLRDRGLDDGTIARWKVGYSTEGRCANRVIVPSYDSHGLLNYFVARTYRRGPMPYLNPDVSLSTVIFGESLIDWNFPVFLVEGAFDAMSIYNAIPMLGKAVPDAVALRLLDKRPMTVLCLDTTVKREEVFRRVRGILDLALPVFLLRVGKYKDLSQALGEGSRHSILKALGNLVPITYNSLLEMTLEGR